MDKGFAHVIILLIFGAAILCNAANPCKDLPDYTHLRDPSNTGEVNCEKYIECKGHSEIYRSCPNGYGYNDETKSCTWANEVCKTKVNTNDCKEEGQVFLDSTGTDCNSFLHCKLKDGSTTQFDTVSEACPTGQIFNPTGYGKYTEGGDKPCSDKTQYHCPKEGPVPNCKKIVSKTYIPDPTNCYGYYYCQDNMRLKNKCDPTQYHFDIHTKSCIYKSDSTCKDPQRTSLTAANICKGNARKFVPDNNICTAYYYCISESIPYQGFCPAGTYYNNGGCAANRPATCSCETLTEGELNVPHKNSNMYWECKYADNKRERSLRTCFKGTRYDSAADSCTI